MRPRFPWMPLFIGDLAADTSCLTAAQFGAYVRLLNAMWTAGGTVPDSDAALARIAGVDGRTWKRVGPVVRGYLMADGTGRLTQKRLAAELAKATARSLAASRAAHERWRPRQERLAFPVSRRPN